MPKTPTKTSVDSQIRDATRVCEKYRINPKEVIGKLATAKTKEEVAKFYNQENAVPLGVMKRSIDGMFRIMEGSNEVIPLSEVRERLKEKSIDRGVARIQEKIIQVTEDEEFKATLRSDIEEIVSPFDEFDDSDDEIDEFDEFDDFEENIPSPPFTWSFINALFTPRFLDEYFDNEYRRENEKALIGYYVDGKEFLRDNNIRVESCERMRNLRELLCQYHGQGTNNYAPDFSPSGNKQYAAFLICLDEVIEDEICTELFFRTPFSTMYVEELMSLLLQIFSKLQDSQQKYKTVENNVLYLKWVKIIIPMVDFTFKFVDPRYYIHYRKSIYVRLMRRKAGRKKCE